MFGCISVSVHSCLVCMCLSGSVAGAYGSMSLSRIGIACSPQGVRADDWCGMAGEEQQLHDGSVCVCVWKRARRVPGFNGSYG